MKRLFLFYLWWIGYGAIYAQEQTQVQTVCPYEKDLVGYYPLSTNANDSSRYQLHGKILGAKSEPNARCGVPAFSFDGLENYIETEGVNPAFQRNLRSFTISLWVNPAKERPESDFFGLLVGRWAFDKTKDQYAVFMNPHNKIVMAVGDGKEYSEGVSNARPLIDYQWHHVVCKWEYPNTITIYINGRKDVVGKQDKSSGMNPTTTVPLKIGRQVIRHSRPYRGYLSSLRIYKRGLTDTEVAELYKYENSICQKFILEGEVLNEHTHQPLDVAADIYIKDLQTGDSILTTQSDSIDGFFRMELPIGYQYGIFAKAQNYRYISINQNIDTRPKEKGGKTAGVANEEVVQRTLFMIPFDIGEKIRMDNVFFETAKSDLKPESYSELDFVLSLFDSFPKLKIEIGGHTDNVGDENYNKRLSQDRANSVTNYLISKGLDPNRIIAKGYGESVPVADNDTEEGRQLNRRVEFTILEK